MHHECNKDPSIKSPINQQFKGGNEKKCDVKIDKIGKIKGNIQKTESVMTVYFTLFVAFHILLCSNPGFFKTLNSCFMTRK